MTLQQVLAELGRADTNAIAWTPLYERVERALAERDAPWLSELLRALVPEPYDGRPAWSPHTHLASVAFPALALVPTADAARETLALAARCRHRTQLAAALAEAHPIHHLEATLASAMDGVARDVAAAWLHESAYHDAAPEQVPALVAWVAELERVEHPLARVPLALTGLERGLRRMGPGIRPRSSSSWHFQPSWEQGAEDPRPALPLVATETQDSELVRRVTAAFVPPGTISNARVEVRRFLLASALDRADLGAPVLRALRPGCITGHTGEDHEGPLVDPDVIGIRSRAVSPQSALAMLLHVAIGSRCYGEYAGVGPGRARAFDAAAALCGLPSSVSFDVIDAEMRRRRFAFFSSDSPWFDHICEDYGLLVLDPSGTELVIVAETDSDLPHHAPHSMKRV